MPDVPDVPGVPGEPEVLPEVTLVVDGVDIPVSEFVRRFVAGTVAGMLSALKGVPGEPKEISLVVKRP